jgi:hypothetical protein
MVNSSFHTENLSMIRSAIIMEYQRTHCWTYFGKHDMRYCPYLCSASPLSLYLSAGLTIAALSFPWASRGAYCSHGQMIQNRRTSVLERTRMFGVSLLSPATCFARRAVEANVRATARVPLVERATAPNGRATASRIAIV